MPVDFHKLGFLGFLQCFHVENINGTKFYVICGFVVAEQPRGLMMVPQSLIDLVCAF